MAASSATDSHCRPLAGSRDGGLDMLLSHDQRGTAHIAYGCLQLTGSQPRMRTGLRLPWAPASKDALAAQRKALADAGCKRIVEDLLSKRGGEQTELRGVLNDLQAGDVVVVPELGCLGRSLPELAQRVEHIATAGASLRSLREGIDTAAPEGRVALGVIGSLNGLAPGTMRGRGSSPPSVQRASGRKAGRRPKLNEQQRAVVVQEVLSKRETGAKMARRYRVSEATVSRVVAAHRAMGDVAAGSRAVLGATRQGERIAGVLPLSALDERLAIVGTSGSGKTYGAKGLVERLVCQGARVCVVDPLGVGWGLRVGPDGDASPLPCPVVVFGGLHADVALDEGMGAALGQLIGTHQIACVVDVSDLCSASARRGFMTAFTEAPFAANTEPLHLMLDEADLWAPQRAQPDAYDLLQRVEEIVRRGRVRGFVPWLITQRPAVLHKDVLSQADILLTMRLTSSQDREAVGRWIEGQADRAEGRHILAACPGWHAARAGCGRPRMACWRGWPSQGYAPSTARRRRNGSIALRRRAGSQLWTFRPLWPPWLFKASGLQVSPPTRLKLVSARPRLPPGRPRENGRAGRNHPSIRLTPRTEVRGTAGGDWDIVIPLLVTSTRASGYTDRTSGMTRRTLSNSVRCRL